MAVAEVESNRPDDILVCPVMENNNWPSQNGPQIFIRRLAHLQLRWSANMVGDDFLDALCCSGLRVRGTFNLALNKRMKLAACVRKPHKPTHQKLARPLRLWPVEEKGVTTVAILSSLFYRPLAPSHPVAAVFQCTV